MLGTILLIILIILLIGALPTWPYSGGWGYYPSSGLGLLLVIIIVLLALGRILASRRGRARRDQPGRGPLRNTSMRNGRGVPSQSANCV